MYTHTQTHTHLYPQQGVWPFVLLLWYKQKSVDGFSTGSKLSALYCLTAVQFRVPYRGSGCKHAFFFS